MWRTSEMHKHMTMLRMFITLTLEAFKVYR